MATELNYNGFFVIVVLIGLTYCQTLPANFKVGDFFPTGGKSDLTESESVSSGPIRDVIKRNSARFRNVLVRNSNSDMEFAKEDARYMTSRGKSKLDILASLVKSRMTGNMLRVEHSWTDQVSNDNLYSLHYEGRGFNVKLKSGDNSKLLELAILALEAGFDWIYYKDSQYIYLSVVPDVCQSKLDLVFIVDTSGSVGYRKFKDIVVPFIQNMVDFFNIGTGQTHIALVSYSYRVYPTFYLNQYNTKTKLKEQIANARYEGFATRTGDALKFVNDHVFQESNGMRTDPSIPKIVILLTDGKSNSIHQATYEANRLRSRQINIFAVGIGGVHLNEMLAVASKPSSKYYYPISNFNDLSGFVDRLSAVSCDEGAQITQCQSATTSIDGGSFKYFRVDFESTVTRVSLEVVDKRGRSYLYASLNSKNPGPLTKDTWKNNNNNSPRTLTIDLGIKKTLYIGIQGQEDSNEFELTIWNSLFKMDEDTVQIMENNNEGSFVKKAETKTPASLFEFEIKHSTPRNDFRINKDTGDIYTTTKLDRETFSSYQLSIVAKHKSNSCYKGLMMLKVIVGDANDKTPSFPNSNTAEVYENSPSNELVVQVKASDLDEGTNAQIRYSIDGQNSFKIDENTGVVRTTRPLDFEDKSRYELKIRATDRGVPSLTGETTLVVTVRDVNERPEFNTPACMSSSNCQFNVNEEILQAQVQTISARDPDTATACTLKYSIVSLDGQFFTIDSNGLIKTKTKLDREIKATYSLTIEVTDCGTPKLSNRATVTVIANDKNDNAPQWPYSSVKKSVIENQGNINVFTFQATDRDIGVNGRIEYTISKTNNNNEFEIDANSGVLRLRSSLDRETKASVQLEITARDKGSPSLSTPVVINIDVIDVNDNSPILQDKSNLRVLENSPKGTEVFTAQASDNDQGLNARIKYAVVGGNTAFSVDESTGRVSTNEIFDRELIDTYTLTLRAQDFGNPSKSQERSYQVNVLDANDNTPKFSSRRYTVNVPENQSPNTQVIQVNATDRDIGRNKEFFFEIVSGHDNKFSISQNDGKITLTGNLDIGIKSFYEITIRVQDRGTPSRSETAVVAVTVTDTNDFSPIFSPATYSTSLDENKPSNTFVVQVRATDNDNGLSGEIVYSIKSQDPSATFYINSATGKIFTRVTLDYETTNKYEITVEASDKGKPTLSATAKVTVNVNDLNDNAPSFTTGSYSISEAAPIGTTVSRIVGEDRDSGLNGEFTFSMVSQNKPFTITSDGNLKIASLLDREKIDRYTVTIKVQDKASVNPKSFQGTITVIILDDNDNSPNFGSPGACEVKENTPADSFICRIPASDPDLGENGTVSFSIHSQQGDMFKINEVTGEIKTKKLIDREGSARRKRKSTDGSNDMFGVTIKTQDNGIVKKVSFLNISIEILDLNDNFPYFLNDPYTFGVREEQNGPIEVGSIHAKDADKDENGRITYSIMDGHIVNGETRFTLTKNLDGTASLKAVVKLDREDRNSYTIRVKAEDNGTSNGVPDKKSAETTVTVQVTDINDHSPVFTLQQYLGSVREGLAPNTYVLKVEATDRDDGTNGQIIYSFKSGANQSHFTINAESGEIRTNVGLDFEAKSQYVFEVQASDKGNPSRSSTSMVTINVINVDDNIPEFGNVSRVSLPENTAIGHQVMTLKASDKDGSSLTYYIARNDVFELQKDNKGGVLMKTKSNLDRETKDFYNISVAVSDSNANVTTHVPITITDVNDNKPIFKPDVYSTQIPENDGNANQIRIIFTVSAVDDDLGQNAEIEYFIKNENNELKTTVDKFSINSITGVIQCISAVDRETKSEYKLEIVAKDKGDPPLQSSVIANVTITDINDNAPIFVKNAYSVSVDETELVNTKILNVNAHDRDEGSNGKVKYRITQGDTSTFTIDENSGEIQNLKHLDRETTASYRLTVEAYDMGIPVQRNNVLVEITLLDLNDNDPVITFSSFIRDVNESSSINNEVGTITATDIDIGSNADLVYKILNDSDGSFFGINAKNGKVHLARRLDRESKSSHNITVIVEDKGRPIRRTQKQFFIQVLDDNDNAPIFTKSSYTCEVKENVPKKSILNISATDRDVGVNAKISYTLSDSHNGMFQISQSNGELSIQKAADFETTSQFTLTVRAADWKHTTNMIVQVNIINVNDVNPVFSRTKYTASVLENSTRRTNVLTVNATDKDPFGGIRYSILNVTGLPFAIDSNSGKVSVSGSLDREEKSTYSFKVKATDNGNPSLSSQTDIEITILDVNDNAPTFSKDMFYAILAENTEPRNSLIKVLATDVDIHNNSMIRYVAVENEQQFEIGEINGVIKPKVKFDRELQTSATFKFRAYDLGVPQLFSEVVTLIVTISDVNDNKPAWSKNETIEIPENSPVNTDISVVIKATDVDAGENGHITYSIVEASSPLKIDRDLGKLSVSKLMDRERKDSYNITVRATDNGTVPLSSDMTISLKVTDINDNSPVFTSSSIGSVSENIKDFIMTLKATDRDLSSHKNGMVKFRLENYFDLFSVDNNTGALSVYRELDREEKSYYLINVTAYDLGEPQLSVTTVLNISVTDVDDNCPTFESPEYRGTIAEDATIGTFVVQVKAIDKDIGTNAEFTYGIMDGNDRDRLNIDPKTGNVTVKRKIDKEIASEYWIKIRAGDENCGRNGPSVGESKLEPNKLATSIVKVTIIDVNDNPPRFSSNFTQVRFRDITESHVITVTAVDADEGEGGKVTYSLLDVKVLDVYRRNITVQASDNGLPRQSSNFTFTLINEERCDAMRFSINTTTGAISADTLCSVNNANKGQLTKIKSESLTLSCTAQGNIVDVKYRWMKDGVVLSDWTNSGRWELNSIEMVHKGSYDCVATSLAGNTQSSSTKLFVHEKPWIDVQPKSVTLSEGESFTLTMIAKGNPEPKYQWFKNNKKISGENSQQFSIDKAINEDTAEYYCNATNDVGYVVSAPVMVKVYKNNFIVKVKVNIKKPITKGDEKCTNFLPSQIEKLFSKVTSKKVVVASKKLVTNGQITNQSFCNITACSENPCLNNGKCTNIDNDKYKCECLPGWTGTNCKEDVNECNEEFKQCKNNATCENKQGSFKCNCPNGFNGDSCEYSGDACAANPCGSSDICVQNTQKKYTCIPQDKKYSFKLPSNKVFRNGVLEGLIYKILSAKGQQEKNKGRKRRETDDKAIDISGCVIHIISQTVSAKDNETIVYFVLDCSSQQINTTGIEGKDLTSFMCEKLTDPSSTLEISECGKPGNMTKPVSITITVEIGVAVVENGVTITSKKAKEIIEESKKKIAEIDTTITVSGVRGTEEISIPVKGQSTLPLIIGTSVGGVLLLSCIIIAALLYRRHNSVTYERQSSIMNKRSKDMLNDYYVAEQTMSVNANPAYTDDEVKNDGSFMFEIPTELKNSN